MSLLLRLAGLVSLLALPAVPTPQGGDLPASPADIEVPPLRDFVPPTPLRRTLGEGGAALLMIEDHELPLVEGLVVLEAGSLRDPDGKAGLAELAVEALREGGCDSFTGEQLNAWLDLRAAELSFEATDDHLRISFSCLSEDLDALLERVGALLASPSFDERAVETARMQLLTAIARSADDSAALADKALDLMLYGSLSPYGRAPSEASVTAITPEDLTTWAAQNLGRDRLTVGLSGDLDPDAAQAAAARAFAGLPEVGPAAEIAPPRFFTPSATRIYVVDRPGVPQTELRIGGPGVRLDSPDHAALTLWGYTVGFGGMSNRMMARVRTELGLAYSVGCLFSSGLSRSGSFYGFCATRNDAVGQALSEMIELITVTGAELIPEAELEAARSRLLASQVFRQDSAAEVLSRAMTLELYGYPEEFWETNLERLRQVDSEMVGLAIREHVPPARFLVVAVGPADEIVPVLEAVAEVEVLEPDAPLADATEQVEALLAAMGGREAWARLETLRLELEVEIAYPNGSSAFIPVQQLRSFEPLAIRMRQVTPAGAAYTNLITMDRAELKSPTGRSEFPASQADTWRTQLERYLYYNLHRLAAGTEGLRAGLDSQGRLMVYDGTQHLAWIELGPEGRPSRMGTGPLGDETVFEYSDWTQTEGLWYAATYVEDGNQTAKISVFEPYVDLPESTWEL